MRFSIITPSFNQLDHLARCAASVASQLGVEDYEHIIQDGGTGEAFDQWAEDQKFARCYQEQDEGMYDAINRGFSKASGEVLSWLNCDEQYLPETLTMVEEFFYNHPEIDIVCGDMIVCDTDLSPLCYRCAIMPWRSHIRRCFLSNYTAATFIRRKVIDDGHFLDVNYKIIADAVWIHKLIGLGYKYAVIPSPLSLFVLTGENLGHTPAAAAEAAHWAERDSVIIKIQAALISVIYQIRKLFAGAYKFRNVNFTFFAGDPPIARHFSGKLGGRWPKKLTSK